MDMMLAFMEFYNQRQQSQFQSTVQPTFQSSPQFDTPQVNNNSLSNKKVITF
jgi:hypothetical protein